MKRSDKHAYLYDVVYWIPRNCIVHLNFYGDRSRLPHYMVREELRRKLEDVVHTIVNRNVGHAVLLSIANNSKINDV